MARLRMNVSKEDLGFLKWMRKRQDNTQIIPRSTVRILSLITTQKNDQDNTELSYGDAQKCIRKNCKMWTVLHACKTLMSGPMIRL
jgi:hypothetical protein